MADLSDIFAASLKKHLEGRPYGTKSRIAKSVGISPSHLGDIIARRTYGTEEKRRAIAACLGYPNAGYEEFLDVGRRILEDEALRRTGGYVAGNAKRPDSTGPCGKALPPDAANAAQPPPATEARLSTSIPNPNIDRDLLYDVFQLVDEFLYANMKKPNLRAKINLVVTLYETVSKNKEADAGNPIKMFRLINEELAKIT